MAISFKPTKSNAEFLDTIQNRNSFFNQLVNLIAAGQTNITWEQMDGEITVSAKKDDMDALKFQRMEADIKRILAVTEKTTHEARIKRQIADGSDFIGRPLPKSTQKAMHRQAKAAIAGTIKANERLECPECAASWLVLAESTLAVTKERLLAHYFETHGFPPEAYQEKLKSLKFAG